MGRTLPARNSCWPRPERGVRSWIPRTASARGSGRSELEGVRQTGPVGTVLRRRERDVQGLSASHNRQFSTGTPTGGRNRRSGHRRKQYRRLYGFDWRSVPVRGPRPVQAVPRDYATDRRTAIEAPRRPVQFEANRLTVSTPDATAQPRNGRDRSRRDRTAVRRGRFDSICRRSHRRTRDTLVGSDEHQAAQLLGVPTVHRTDHRHCRGIRHYRRSPNRSVDLADVSKLRVNREHNSTPRRTHLHLWVSKVTRISPRARRS